MSLTSKNTEKIGAVNRGTPCESGLCNFCRTDCQGRCETWLSSLLGRRTLVPRDYGNATIGTENTTHVGVSYNALRIRGRVFGGAGLDPEKARTGDAAYCDADLTTAVGSNAKYPCDYPFLIGALSRNPVVDKYWDSFAVGAALCGIPLVIGENVGGGDNKTEFNPDGSIRALPDLDRRIAVYRRYYNGKGALFVQLNANDAYNGVADYVARKYGDFVCVEIKWGQGAKPINGEGLIRDLDYARFMKSRSYCLRPDPEDPAVQEAFRAGRVKHFTRYTGLTYPALSTPEEVLAEVAAKAEQLRANGAARLALKTGAFGMPDLALAIRVASELDFELLTIDGSGGGTGMSPNDMLDNWGVPSVLLHAKAHDYAFLRAAAGKKVVDLAMGGGLAKPSQAFKALALGAPYVKAVCMSRSFMIPAFLGCNIEGALHPERRERVHGAWSALPKTVLDIGDTPETIFAGYHALKERLGADEMAHIPYGAIAMWTMCDRLGAGLQHHMAGARKFGVEHIDRTDICAANRETAQETGIPFITEQDDELARRIVLG